MGLRIFIWEFLAILGFAISVSTRGRFSDWVARAPGLDLAVGATTWVPWCVAFIAGGIPGLCICLIAQFLAVSLACSMHTEFCRIFRGQEAGALRRTLGGIVGQIRVVVGVWITTFALPAFLVMRLGQVTVYPLLSFVLGFPKYKHGEWIRVSRHKFEGLIGLDLWWCLYCEWSAGVFSLAGEMVRNNESFWCPIKFYDKKHCENCTVDFPDLAEWVPLTQPGTGTSTIHDVQEKLKSTYAPQPPDARAWYGFSRQKKTKPET